VEDLERQLCGALKALQNNHIDLVVVLLPRKDTGIYQIIKKVADTDVGIHTICHVVLRNGSPNTQPGVLANLVLKFNIKLGGDSLSANQVLSRQGPILTDNTMILGIDVVS
jgi:eukaryotic translation initiation factor 2C